MRTRAAFPGFGKGKPSPSKGKTFPPEILTPDEVLAILEACGGTLLGARNRALLTVLYRSGLRCAEALALRPKDIDLAVGSIAVLHGKGDRSRIVGIDPGAAPIITTWMERREAELAPPPGTALFCSRRCKPMTKSSVRELLIRLASSAGITKRVHPHGLRHTMAYELLMEGLPVPIIQRQLGHTSLATTDRYLDHIAPIEVIEFIQTREWTPR